MIAATAFVYYVLDWGLMDSLLIGAMVSGTSPAIVMPLIGRAKVTAEISSLLNIESALNGALVIVIALVILYWHPLPYRIRNWRCCRICLALGADVHRRRAIR